LRRFGLSPRRDLLAEELADKGYAVIVDQPPSADEHLVRQVMAERDRLAEQVAFLQRLLDEAARRGAALLRLVDARGEPSAG
jgi:hypothetical protein